jgi:ABC-type glycerol-3-phosphate transport system permease component
VGGSPEKPERHRAWSIPKSLLAALLVVPFAYPLVFLVVTALRPGTAYNQSPLGFSGFPTFSNISYAWYAGSLGHDALNSLLAVSIGVFTCIAASSLAAYWFYRHEGIVAKALLGLLFIGWAAPFASYLVAFYVLLANHHLTNNLIALGLAYGAIYTPFGTFFILAYQRQTLSKEILEAAAVDGASLLKQFARIVLPLSRPAISTLAALTFAWLWGEIIVSVVLVGSDPSKFTIVLGTSTLVGATLNASGSANSIDTVAAATLIGLIPSLSVIYLAQRAIVRGFGTGGVKG